MENQIIKRIYAKIVCDIKTRCWNWTGYLNHNGYGLITINGKTHRVHRLIYQKLCGPIPEDKPCILHRCDNRKCCNPKHLYAGTLQDNAIDRSKRNPKSYQIGEKHGRTHLTEKDILEIRASEETQIVLAKRFRVCKANISFIQHRQTWKHL
jgi:hypothetical protein